MSHRIGYARVSTGSQSYEIQEEMLRAAGVTRIYHDKASGKNLDRSDFKEMAARLDAGDVVVVTKLDRLGRSLRDLICLVEDWQEAGITNKNTQ